MSSKEELGVLGTWEVGKKVALGLSAVWRPGIGLGRMQILAMKAKSVIPLAVQDVDGHLSIPFLSFVSFGFIGFMV